jgi:Micrococcal nuclease (thermonuclease) homologs
MRQIFLAGLLGFMLLVFASEAHAWGGVVTRVLDGDTITVKRDEDGLAIKIRLHGIDAPESTGGMWTAQPYSRQSTNLLKELVLGKRVEIVPVDQDKYGRDVAGVVQMEDGRVAQEELIRAGLAWVYRKYTKSQYLIDMEEEARAAKRGLWAWRGGPEAPWDYRARMKKERAEKKAGVVKDE